MEDRLLEEMDRVSITTRELAALRAQVEALRGALEKTLDAMRRLRGLAFTGSRIPIDRYPEKKMADEADTLARQALALAGKETT